MHILNAGAHAIDLATPCVMGIVNVTADSFFDGGRLDADAAIDHARRMLEDGARIVDVGGESTRPGAMPVDAEEELRRVLPVVAALARDGACVSIDTMKPAVMRAALDAGIGRDRIVIDPGFGFGKSVAHNLELLRGLGAITSLGYPVLGGLSRKSLLGAITGRGAGDRLAASIAAALAAVMRGARIVRVHDVAATVDALAVWNAVEPWPALQMREQAQQ
jgi:dihydropteroate synthase